jgi:hypothetical protein
MCTRQEIPKTRKQNMSLLNSSNNAVKLAHVLTCSIIMLVAPGSTPLWVKSVMKSQPWTSSWYPYDQAWGCHWQLWRLHQTIAMAYKSNPWIVMLRRYWNILFIIPLDFYNYRIDYNFHLPHPTWTHQKLEMKRIPNFDIYVFFSLATFFFNFINNFISFLWYRYAMRTEHKMLYAILLMLLPIQILNMFY